MRLAFALSLVALHASACWTGEVSHESPPAPSTALPVPQAPRRASREVGDSRLDMEVTSSIVRMQRLGSPTPKALQQAEDALATLLRADGPLILPKLVAGPVVALDVGAGTFTTLCGRDAARASHDWGMKLADMTLPAPRCSFFIRGGTPMRVESEGCWQFTAHEGMFLVFEGHDADRLIAVIDGWVPPEPDQALGRELAKRIATATCP
jgi:hypothetical protein